MLKERDIHRLYQVKCLLMLAVLVDSLFDKEIHYIEAEGFCTQLYESRQNDEQEEILSYQRIITEGRESLKPELM